MKKNLILTLVFTSLVLVASCGNSGYSPITRTPGDGGVDPAQPVVNPADAFNTKWSVDVSNRALSATEKVTLASFLGYNTMNISSKDYCNWGSKTGSVGYDCYSNSDLFRNYLKTSNPFIVAVPAPKDLGNSIDYKVRFAADLTSDRHIKEGKAYLQIIVDGNDHVEVDFSTMSGDLVVTQTSSNACGTSVECYSVKGTWTDACGTVRLTAFYKRDEAGVLAHPDITYTVKPESYKNASCYFGGKLPNTSYQIDAPNGLPTIVDKDSSGRGWLFKNQMTPTLIEE